MNPGLRHDDVPASLYRLSFCLCFSLASFASFALRLLN
jgi:hypothetical protein